MCLEKLAEKDSLWREMAFRLCGCRIRADELVQQMYIRRVDNDRGQEWNEYYVAMVLRSIFLNKKKTDKYVLTDEIYARHDPEPFEPDDYEQGLLDKVEDLTYNQKELLELSYDYSLRGIQDRFGVNYLYAHRELKKARTKILNGDLSKYENSRLKYRNMAKSEKKKNDEKNEQFTAEYYESLDKRSREYKTYMAGKEAGKAELAEAKKNGLGDAVEKAIETLVPSPVISIIKQADCGCDDRKAWLNEKGKSWRDAVTGLFHGREQPKVMSPEDLSEYGDFVRSRSFILTSKSHGKGKLTPSEVNYVCELYSEVFRRELWKPKCSSCLGEIKKIASIIYKLDTLYFNSVELAE